MLDLQLSDYFIVSGFILAGLTFLLSTWVLSLAKNRNQYEKIQEIQILEEPQEKLDDITTLTRQSQYDLDELLALSEQIAETETVPNHEPENENAPNPEDDELLAIIEQIAENERTSAVADDDELIAALEQIAENERNANTVINDGRLAAELQQITENERAERLVRQEDDEYIAIVEQFREYETDLNANNDRPVIPGEQILENDVAGHPDGARNDVEVENQNDLNTFECEAVAIRNSTWTSAFGAEEVTSVVKNAPEEHWPPKWKKEKCRFPAQSMRNVKIHLRGVKLKNLPPRMFSLVLIG